MTDKSIMRMLDIVFGILSVALVAVIIAILIPVLSSLANLPKDQADLLGPIAIFAIAMVAATPLVYFVLPENYSRESKFLISFLAGPILVGLDALIAIAIMLTVSIVLGFIVGAILLAVMAIMSGGERWLIILIRK